MTSILEVEQLDTLSSNASSTLTIGGTNTTTIAFGPNVTTTPSSLKNTPAFEAEISSTFNISNGVATLAPFDTEIFDTDDMYDNSASNYKFTPTVAGKYFVYGRLFFLTGTFAIQRARIWIYKNGSLYGNSSTQFDTGNVVEYTPMIGQVVEMNGSTDFLQIYVYMLVNSGTPQIYQDTGRNVFGAYRIIGA